MEEMKCEVCGQTAIGVYCSTTGAISFAYCRECVENLREPWSALVANCSTLERGHVADWFKPVIKATLEFYGKTEDELWEEAESAWKEYEEFMKNAAANT